MTGLSKLFDELNAKFFGSMPKYRVVLAMAATGCKHGESIPERRLIRISKHLEEDPAELRKTLLHEMCTTEVLTTVVGSWPS